MKMMQRTGYNFRCKPSLHKDNMYGFRLKSPDTLVAIGEAAWSSKDPFSYGEEWNIIILRTRIIIIDISALHLKWS